MTRASPLSPLTTLIVLAKAPRPGFVKTRLSPDYSPEEAASLAAASLADTLDVVESTRAARRMLLLEGPAQAWQRRSLEVVAQQGRGLDERLAFAFSLVHGPALLVGMDTPQVTRELLDVSWDGIDAWFGPAGDGGFWALGFAVPPDPGLLLGVPMSRADTGARQRARLVAAGLRVGDLPELTDFDSAADVATVAALAPHGRFARRADELAMNRWAPR